MLMRAPAVCGHATLALTTDRHDLSSIDFSMKRSFKKLFLSTQREKVIHYI